MSGLGLTLHLAGFAIALLHQGEPQTQSVLGFYLSFIFDIHNVAIAKNIAPSITQKKTPLTTKQMTNSLRLCHPQLLLILLDHSRDVLPATLFDDFLRQSGAFAYRFSSKSNCSSSSSEGDSYSSGSQKPAASSSDILLDALLHRLAREVPVTRSTKSSRTSTESSVYL